MSTVGVFKRKFYVSSGCINKITVAETELEAAIKVLTQELQTESVEGLGLLTLVSERGFLKDMLEKDKSGILIATCDILEEMGGTDIAAQMRDAVVKKHVQMLQKEMKLERRYQQENQK